MKTPKDLGFFNTIPFILHSFCPKNLVRWQFLVTFAAILSGAMSHFSAKATRKHILIENIETPP